MDRDVQPVLPGWRSGPRAEKAKKENPQIGLVSVYFLFAFLHFLIVSFFRGERQDFVKAILFVTGLIFSLISWVMKRSLVIKKLPAWAQAGFGEAAVGTEALTLALCRRLPSRKKEPVVVMVIKLSSNVSAPVAGQDEEIQLVTVSGPSALSPSDVSAIALDFKVLHPVVITRLGVFPSGPWPELQGNVTVKLLQLDQEVPANLQMLLSK